MRKIILLLIALITSSCVTTKDKNYFPYKYNKSPDISYSSGKIIVLPISYFEFKKVGNTEMNAQNISDRIKRYLRVSGFDVIDEQLFIQAYEEEVKMASCMFDPLTGERDNTVFGESISNAIQDTLEKEQVDFFIFPSFLYSKVDVGTSGKSGSWDGVSRTYIIDNNARSYFNNPRVVSLKIKVYSPKHGTVLSNRSGLEILDKIVANKSQTILQPRTDLFLDEDLIDESVKIALHPFIKYESYGK